MSLINKHKFSRLRRSLVQLSGEARRLRLHGEHSFNAFPLVVRCGGMPNAFGPKVGRKVVHPDTGDVTVACEGFNMKNHYDREAPCDQDYLRKMSKDTDADALMRWFCNDVVQVFRSRRAFDKEGIFIGDGSYLFVPDYVPYCIMWPS